MRLFTALLLVLPPFRRLQEEAPSRGCRAPHVAEASPPPAPTPEPVDLTSQVIVLCYHRFEDKPKDSLAIKPSDFEAQMQSLKDNGITVIPMADFLAWRRGEKSIPAKSAVVSIDDGYISGYAVAWPILKKFGYPFTMFIYTDYVKGGPKSGGQSITWEQLAEMRDAGVDIQSHTVSHSSLNARKGKTDEQYLAWLKNEISGSKELLEQHLGIQIKAIAYPYGLHNDPVREAVKQAGYEAAFTVYGQRIGYGADPTMIGRYAIESTKPKVFEEAANFTGSVEGGGRNRHARRGHHGYTANGGRDRKRPKPGSESQPCHAGQCGSQECDHADKRCRLVPATYDPETKLVSYKVTQKLYAGQVTVIVAATVNGRKTEARWSFNVGSKEAKEANPVKEAS